MKVTIPISFDVETDEENSPNLTEDTARLAAAEAAHHYLSFVKVSGYSTDSEEVEVEVDGFGECTVRLGDN